jgi:hypothetical protein
MNSNNSYKAHLDLIFSSEREGHLDRRIGANTDRPPPPVVDDFLVKHIDHIFQLPVPEIAAKLYVQCKQKRSKSTQHSVEKLTANAILVTR